MEQAVNLHPLLVENDVRGLVFDLDGTLIDSAADILQGMRLTFAQAGLGILPDNYFPDDLHGTGEGIMRSIMADMGWAAPPDLKPLRALYVQNYASLDHRQTRLYADAQHLLAACAAAELPMGICTNKLHTSALAATRKVGIESHFRYISGADTWAAAKPSPVPLVETIRMLDLQPKNVLYFGDTSVDAECARQAGVRFVLHKSGYGDEELKGTSQYFSFDNWKELLA